MTDKELVQALRCCGKLNKACGSCPADNLCQFDGGQTAHEEAADRLEALLAENEHLREVTKMVPRWHPASEPPETENQVLVTFTGWIGKKEYIGGYLLAEYVPGEGWILEEYPQLENPNVTYWQYLPEPPSTEGVE